MTCPLEWSLAANIAVLVLYGFWLSRTERRLRRSVRALEEIVKPSQGSVASPSTLMESEDRASG